MSNWQCGCGHVNGPNLVNCAYCNRTPAEGGATSCNEPADSLSPPRTDTLLELAIAYHKSPAGEGEYGCNGATCPGVQRLHALLLRAAALDAAPSSTNVSQFIEQRAEAPATDKEGSSLSVAETQRLLGSDRPISIGKVPTDPIGMRAIASIVRERTATPPDCGLSANDLYHVMLAWERMPASEEQTRIVIGLGKLREAFIRRGDSKYVTDLAPLPPPPRADDLETAPSPKKGHEDEDVTRGGTLEMLGVLQSSASQHGVVTTPVRNEWRLDEAGALDDVVVDDVETFRLERMGHDHVWGRVYHRDGSQTDFNMHGNRGARVSLTFEHEAARANHVADSAQILSSERSTSDRPRGTASSSSLPPGVSYMICALCSHTKYSDRECLSCFGLGPVKAKEPMMTEQYDADSKMMFLAADGSMMCETHPGREWPHDDCAGPGMPWIIQGRTLIEETRAGAAVTVPPSDWITQFCKEVCWQIEDDGDMLTSEEVMEIMLAKREALAVPPSAPAVWFTELLAIMQRDESDAECVTAIEDWMETQRAAAVARSAPGAEK